MKTLATYSIKGGVGKTTAAVNLAHAAALAGGRVLLWDLDPQGAATFLVRVKPVVKGGTERLVGGKGALESHIRGSDCAGLHIVPADFSLRNLDLYLDDTKQPTRRLATLLEPLADDYDVAVLDCPPGVTLTSESVIAAVDALIVPTVPTTLSRRTLDQLSAFVADGPARPMVLPFASMVDRRKKLHRDLVVELSAGTPPLLPTAIPNASVVELMGVERQPLAAFAPSSPSAKAFAGLWSDVAERLWT